MFDRQILIDSEGRWVDVSDPTTFMALDLTEEEYEDLVNRTDAGQDLDTACEGFESSPIKVEQIYLQLADEPMEDEDEGATFEEEIQ